MQQILRNEYHCTLPKRFSRKKTSNTMMQTHRNEHKHVHQHLTHLICKCCATHQTTHNNTEPPGCPSFVILTLLHLNGISKHIHSKSYAVSMTFHDCDHFPGLENENATVTFNNFQPVSSMVWNPENSSKLQLLRPHRL